MKKITIYVLLSLLTASLFAQDTIRSRSWIKKESSNDDFDKAFDDYVFDGWEESKATKAVKEQVANNINEIMGTKLQSKEEAEMEKDEAAKPYEEAEKKRREAHKKRMEEERKEREEMSSKQDDSGNKKTGDSSTKKTPKTPKTPKKEKPEKPKKPSPPNPLKKQ